MRSLSSRLFLRLQPIQFPVLCLMALLQRTPVLRWLLLPETSWLQLSSGQVLRSTAFVALAAGAVDTMAGATTFTTNPASPASATVGTAFTAAFAVTGAPSAVKSYTITGLPPGLSVTSATLSGSTYTLNASTGSITGTPTTAGNYTVTITAWEKTGGTGQNKANSYKINVTGAAATAPSITGPPTSQTVTAGSSVTFSVTATGTAPLTYQWNKGGVAISGATSSSYTIASTVTGDAGSYTVTVTNSAGSATSSAATLTVNAAAVAPAISTQPVSQTVTAGASVTFSVAATGTAPLSYQWKKDTVNIAGATSASYSIATTVTGDSGSYTVVVTNSVGSVTSSAATLTVNAPVVAPAITSQPSSQTVTAGNSASFSVTATGTAPLTYQWKKDSLNISGATSASYSIASTVAADAGSYSVVVTNAAGSATSNAATLTVNPAPVAPSITTQPLGQTVNTGSAVTFSVTATGTAPLSYQWKKDNVAISGATSASYSISSTVTGDSGSYTVVVTNSVGSVTSNAAALTVNAVATPTAPSISSQPVSQTVTAGAAVSFSVAASGTAPLSYQWKKDNVNISGATNATYAIAAATAGDAGSYTVVVTNSVGNATSNAATLTVNAVVTAPAITTQPASQSVTAGAAASFTVAASGSTPLTYQWIKDGNAISGATSATYSIASTTAGDAGSYSVTVTNSAGSATSNAATLTVTPLATAPAITTQPASLTVSAGAAASFTVAASGTAPLTYQWKKDGATIAGATSATYSIAAAAAGDAGSYTVTVTNSAGSATSNAATLTVNASAPTGTAPAITAQPADQSVNTGASVTFSVTASGTAPLTYQWRRNGTALAGGGSASYSIVAATVDDAGRYSVAVTNAYGSVVSNEATLTVTVLNPGPVITEQLKSQTVTSGHGCTFTAQAITGVTYQWEISTNSGASWANVTNGSNFSGATTATLSITSVTTAQGGSQFRYRVTNSGGSATSNAATLQVNAVLVPSPAGLVIDSSGNLVVSDSSLNSIQKVSAAGVISVFAGANGSAGTTDGTGSAALFNQPAGLAIAGNGVLYVSDSANATIRRIETDGRVSTIAGSSSVRGSADGAGTSATFSGPTALALDGTGNLYVADTGNSVIRRISSTTVVTTLAGSAGQTGTSDGTGSAARFNHPQGLAVDAAGTVYVADTLNSTIRRIGAGGVVTTLAGVPGITGTADGTGSGALFNQPTGLALDAGGNLWVADTGNNSIRRVTPAGVVTTIAGLPTVAGLEDGTGMAALFNQPKALVADGAGNVFVADVGNAALRKVTPEGVVTTLSLTGPTSSSSSGGSSGSSSGSSGGTSSGGTTTPASSGGGGGGGAPSEWFLAALAVATLLRRRRRA